jgi:hypothetical protein
MDDEPIDREEYERWEQTQKKHPCDFQVGQRVIHVPDHANGDTEHIACEHGTVSSLSEQYVFVKFDEQTNKLGWHGANSQACDPNDLREAK